MSLGYFISAAVVGPRKYQEPSPWATARVKYSVLYAPSSGQSAGEGFARGYC